MPLSLKNPELERLARLIAKEANESITEAIQIALSERWQRLKKRRYDRLWRQKIEDILHRVDRLPTLDSRHEDEILGYDEHGAPR
jgi:antitoxin VapB